jgi:hypothetical protein
VCEDIVSSTDHSDSVFLPLSGGNRQLTGGNVDHYLVLLELGELLFHVTGSSEVAMLTTTDFLGRKVDKLLRSDPLGFLDELGHLQHLGCPSTASSLRTCTSLSPC